MTWSVWYQQWGGTSLNSLKFLHRSLLTNTMQVAGSRCLHHSQLLVSSWFLTVWYYPSCLLPPFIAKQGSWDTSVLVCLTRKSWGSQPVPLTWRSRAIPAASRHFSRTRASLFCFFFPLEGSVLYDGGVGVGEVLRWVLLATQVNASRVMSIGSCFVLSQTIGPSENLCLLWLIVALPADSSPATKDPFAWRCRTTCILNHWAANGKLHCNLSNIVPCLNLFQNNLFCCFCWCSNPQDTISL